MKILSWSSQLGSHNFVQKRYFIQFINYMLSLMAEINQFYLFSATFFSVQGGNFLTFDGNNKQTWDDFCNLHLHFKCLKRFYRFSNPGGFSFKNKIYLFKFLSWQSRNLQNKWSAFPSNVCMYPFNPFHVCICPKSVRTPFLHSKLQKLLLINIYYIANNSR